MISHRFIWLHGFASSPASSKGRFVRQRLAERGAWLDLPDLNQPSFKALTVGRSLAQLDELAAESAPRKVVLLGSSLGGYTAAAWAAQRTETCAALVLLAPAFELGGRWTERMEPEDVARWRRDGQLEFEHYAWGRKEPLGWRFLEEALARDPYPLPQAPTLVLQGLRDEVVPPQLAREFVRRMEQAGRTVRLIELDEGHELSADLPGLWRHLEAFLRPWL
jgi:uncharacterized protein